MKRIFNLHRLDFFNVIATLVYFLKRILGIKTTPKENAINEYYFHLIQCNGFLKTESPSFFVSFYPEWKLTIKTRKRPSSDLAVFRQIFQVLEYKAVAETYAKHFNANQPITVIDAGSNTGLATLYLSRVLGDATFICIEPDDANFETLSFNLEANSVKNLYKIKAGVWSKDANLKLIKDFRDKGDWSIRVQETQEQSCLQAFSINYFVEHYQLKSINILKMDIEGSEAEIFSDVADTSFLAITKCIAIEIHDEFNCRELIYETLKKYHFSYFSSGELTIGINQKLIKNGEDTGGTAASGLGLVMLGTP